MSNELSPVEKLAQAKQQEADLRRMEEKEGRSGAVPNLAKMQLLDAAEVQKRHPDKHIRWINIGSTERAQLRQSQGYVVLPESEGGKKVGNLALAYIPRKLYEMRIAELKKINKTRLNSHRTEMEATAEAVAQILRDKNVDISAGKILISEG